MEQVIVNSFISSGFYLLMGLSFWIIYSTLRFFHLAHGGVYTIGAYLAYSVINFWDNRFSSFNVKSQGVSITIYIFSIIVAIVAASLSGVLISYLVYHPLRKRKASNLILLLASFGLFIFIQNLVALIYGNKILSLRTGPIKEGLNFLGAVITTSQILIISSALFVFIFLFILINYTKIGKAMKAVSDDPVTASTTGINPEKIILFAFILGSALVGFSGVLISFETNLEPTMGFNMLLKGLIAVIIGGIGNLNGALLGSLFLGFTENLSVWFLPGGWKDALVFGIFLIFLLFKPQGILGKRRAEIGLFS